jgi:hypothetical protein
MKQKAHVIGILTIIVIITMVSGCYYRHIDFSNTQIVREYTQKASSNVVFNVYIYPSLWNFTVIESNTTNVTVIESFYLRTINEKYNYSYIQDYVNFTDYENNITVDISAELLLEASPTMPENFKFGVLAYVPKNTHYTINRINNSFGKMLKYPYPPNW